MKNFWIGLSLPLLVLSSCAKKATPTVRVQEPVTEVCATADQGTKIVSGSSGTGVAFDLNPQIAASDATLLPTSSKIENLATPVTLERLLGLGTLSGQLVDVRNGLCTGESIGAYSATNDFSYPHKDQRFAEVMSYYYGDNYRKVNYDADVMKPDDSVFVLTHCPVNDNAFFTRNLNKDGTFTNIVCLGTAIAFSSQQATFSDDSEVVIHELQHAQTTYSYSPTLDVNQFEYDEAGAMNEGISDAIALMHSYDRVKPPFDPKRFSFWALGNLFGTDGDFSRGAHRCPTYDPTFPNCTNFKPGAAGFSADQNTVSFTYPDGMGWPYAGFYSGNTAVKNAFTNTSFQEIHQASLIISGTIYEVFESLLKTRPTEYEAVRLLMTKIVSRATQYLPKPKSAISLSPITFPIFFAQIVSAAEALGVSDADLVDIKKIGEDRGLFNAPQLSANWASVIGYRFTEETGSAHYDGILNVGDTGMIWFNIQNQDAITAGGVVVDFKLADGDTGVDVLGIDANFGAVSNREAMIQYGKVNGTAIVTALQSTTPAQNIAVKNTYFGTYSQTKAQKIYTATGIHINVTGSPGMHSATLRLIPTNGPEVTVPVSFEVKP